MKRVVLLAAVFLAVGASGAQASPVLKGPEARRDLVRWSLNHNMVKAKVGRCLRKSPSHLRCEMKETGWWGNPREETWANGVVSWYSARRASGGGIRIRWSGFAWGKPCTYGEPDEDPSLPPCPLP